MRTASISDASSARPRPADTVFGEAARGHYDAVLAMYHDQGLIPVKLDGLSRVVNVTLGLPIVRTSVCHGTAFDIAYQGQASTGSFVSALRYAVKLAGGPTGGQC